MMRLLYTPFSPFSRKILIAAEEKGLREHLQLEIAEVGTHVPLASEAHDRLSAIAPLTKVPVLLDEDLTLYDSPVIAEYIDSLGERPKLIPSNAALRWRALRRQALGDGIMDAAILCQFELLRTPAKWDDWEASQLRRIDRALNALNLEAPFFTDSIDIGTISVACALGYLDFRFDHLQWRSTRAPLAEWFAAFERRPSMESTRPDRS